MKALGTTVSGEKQSTPFPALKSADLYFQTVK